MKKITYKFLLLITIISAFAMQTEKGVRILQHSFLLPTPLSSETICLVLIKIPLIEKKYKLVLDSQEQQLVYDFEVKMKSKGWIWKGQENNEVAIPNTQTIALTVPISSDKIIKLDKMFIILDNQDNQPVSQVVKF